MVFHDQSNKILPLVNDANLDEIIDTRKNSSSDRISKFEGGSGQKSSGRSKQIPQIEFQSGMSEEDSVKTTEEDSS